ncbi:uncharacterized protein VP01_2516g2 [Puccinia sorghi]|uniref:Uncharacterized protein n=1 Tax=Puccinia sorghi TaxID=27349 RepID=A0A0L6V666_9BASI|nr:uncharacterized protein VP01_2516g2 [Puccinia sorghi]
MFPVSAGQPFSLQEIWTDTKIVKAIPKAGPQDQHYTLLLDSVKSSASRSLNPNLSSYTVKNNLLFRGHRIVVPRNSIAKRNHPKPSQLKAGWSPWTCQDPQPRVFFSANAVASAALQGHYRPFVMRPTQHTRGGFRWTKRTRRCSKMRGKIT